MDEPNASEPMIKVHPEGATLVVRVHPRARRDAVDGEHHGALKVSVTVPAEDGRANDAVIELLRQLLGVRRTDLTILSGQTNRTKVLLVRGLAPDHLARAVRGMLG